MSIPIDLVPSQSSVHGVANAQILPILTALASDPRTNKVWLNEARQSFSKALMYLDRALDTSNNTTL